MSPVKLDGSPSTDEGDESPTLLLQKCFSYHATMQSGHQHKSQLSPVIMLQWLYLFRNMKWWQHILGLDEHSLGVF